MSRDTSLGATWKQLEANGYAPTSATNPDRIVSTFAHQRNQADSFLALSDHAAAIQTYPTHANGGTFNDCRDRQVIALVVTAFLLADPKQAKAVEAILAEHKLNYGPVQIDGAGNHVRPIQWNGEPIFDGQHAARLCHDDDDATVYLAHAIAPSRYQSITDHWSRTRNVATEPVGSHVIRLDGEWRNGHLLDTHRSRLPELFLANIAPLIRDIEKARWNARPAARKDAAV